MGQSEVLTFLEEELVKDHDKWWSIDEVKDRLNKEFGFTGNVWRHVNKLCATEQVETKLMKLDNCRWGYKRVVQAKNNISK